ncbi:MAG TPA: diaminopimelate dehydrogenase [Tissierellales bacterium]|nr:diaminopimelate dehydrogenase [Tissierellales bacterium]
MENKIRVGIVGYGNLGKGVELALKQNNDFVLKGIFTRRDVSLIKSNLNVIHISKVLDYKDEIDVMILCGGSANDLPEQCPVLSSCFNTIDAYDNHSKIPDYFNMIDNVARESNKVSLISVGWDPGLFSINRLLAQAILPKGQDYTFWGEGVSQGHSEAVGRIKGVKHAAQYTIPIKDAIERARSGENPQLEAREKHKRICYVVPFNFDDVDRIEKEIKTMPDYFLDYDTTVHFITEEKFIKDHSEMPHGGFVISTDINKNNHRQRMEFNLSLDNNPEFTAAVLVAFARGVYRMALEGKKGAFSIFDIPLSYISPKSNEELRKELL